MRISYRWLGRHVDLRGLSPAEVAEDLTLRTAEVEGLEPFAPVLEEVVVGHVLARERHPDADKLSLCQVDVGSGEPLPIVCGAPNVDAGQRVAVARVGTVLSGDLRIKKSKIRGVTSHGMICSERELGLGEEHSGIWVLPADASIGEPASSAFGAIENGGQRAIDWVLEIDNKSLTHRPDLWGHRGLAGEVAAIRGLDLAPLESELPASGEAAPFPVRIESAGCARYLALPIDGVRVEAAPQWMRLLLLAAGQRPLDLLVDVSNFVMLDLGQPNHLFDRRRLSPEGIVVRDARAGERMRTLDGSERELTPADLLICSGEEPVALAGVMGGEGSKVDPSTTELLLEVASFSAVRVRRTAMRLGLRSEASARFEKSLDPNLPAIAAGHLVRLLAELQPDLSLPAPPTDAGDWEDPAHTLSLRLPRARSVLGLEELARDEVETILTRLGFGVVSDSDEVLSVAVPSRRATKDVTAEEDLIEEVGRMVRYDRIPERLLSGEFRPAHLDRRRELVRALADDLAGGARFHEALGYSFVPEAWAQRLGIADQPYVEVVNPVSEGLQRVRRSVLPSLIGFLESNLRHRDDVRLFEIGKGYLPEHADDRGQPREIHELGLLWAAPRPAGQASLGDATWARLQGTIEELVQRGVGGELTWARADADDAPAWAHAGRCAAARLVDPATSARARTEVLPRHRGEPFPTRPVALLTTLEPALARELAPGSEVALGLVSIDRLVETPEAHAVFRPLPRFPGVKVDVALALPPERSQAEVAEAIRDAGKGLVEELELFDLYAGESVGQGRRSLAYHVLLQSPQKTLTDKDCHRFLDRLERAAQALGGELRRE